MALTEGAAARAMDLMLRSGLMRAVLPEVAQLVGCEQPTNSHPEGDVFVHTRLALSILEPGCSETLAFGTLLHDIAKPQSRAQHEGKVTFFGHTERRRGDGDEFAGSSVRDSFRNAWRIWCATICGCARRRGAARRRSSGCWRRRGLPNSSSCHGSTRSRQARTWASTTFARAAIRTGRRESGPRRLSAATVSPYRDGVHSRSALQDHLEGSRGSPTRRRIAQPRAGARLRAGASCAAKPGLIARCLRLLQARRCSLVAGLFPSPIILWERARVRVQ